MRKIICLIKGHKRGDTWYKPRIKSWYIKCDRCDFEICYASPLARLIGMELYFGFDGK